MNEEYCFLIVNDTLDLVHFLKKENLSDENDYVEISMHQREVLKDIRTG
jgi:hypothetical protein